MALFERGLSADELADSLPGLGQLDEEAPRELLGRVLLGPAAELLCRPSKAFRARLVEIGWSLSGADEPAPVALGMAVEALHAGSLVVDDIQDDSSHRRGGPALHRTLGTPLALNLGNWLYFWPFALIEALGLPARRELEVRRRITRVLSDAHVGQALDVGVPVHELAQDDVASVVRSASQLKTGRLMSLAASIGPAAAGAPAERTAALEAFGLAMGIGLQMLDDLGSLLGHREPSRRLEDLRLGRATWTWAWLAERMDETHFAALQACSMRVRGGAEDAETLATRLRQELDGREQERIHAHLEAALGALEAVLGPETKLTALRTELERLESSYV